MEPLPNSPLEGPRFMERDTLAELLERELTWLRAHCQRLTQRERGAAEDLVQETCLRLLRTISLPHQSTPRSLRAWLSIVARNLWRDRCRSQGRVSFQEIGVEQEPKSDETDQEGCLQELWDARCQLQPRLDLAILLRDYCGCEFEIIANILQCSTPAAANQLRRRALALMFTRLHTP